MKNGSLHPLKPRTPGKPTVFVIAGPNGAGKTTFASQFLPKFADCPEFLNADLIAAGLSPFAPETQNLRAGRLVLERIRVLTRERASFGFETTLSGRTYLKLLRDMKAVGYRAELYFIWLHDVETCVARVQNRAQQGGHSIPPADIRRRYSAGLRNMFQLYLPIFDAWRLFDGSTSPPSVIAFQESGQFQIKMNELYRAIERQLGNLS